MSYLDRIFRVKHEEIEAAKRSVPLDEIMAKAAEQPPARGFRKALECAETPLALIAEVKKASPSQGLIRADFDAATIAQTYKRAGAHALSVLTDVQFFQGGPENLRAAKAATDLPCLRKDFIDDPYQVFEARAWGADAILLILASLPRNLAEDLQCLAWEIGMDTLVEVHSPAEADTALSIGANLIGVNNRNLSDFKTDIAISEEILPAIRDRALTVSESALNKLEDLERVRAAGARAVLIGTSFCSAPDIEQKVREVMGWRA